MDGPNSKGRSSIFYSSQLYLSIFPFELRSLPKMWENELQSLFQTAERAGSFIQTSLCKFIVRPSYQTPSSGKPLFSLSSSSKQINPSNNHPTASLQPDDFLNKKPTTPVNKEELGRATWIFLHTLAAQYPDNPTRQQKKDVKELMAILSRMYPCKECADHFKELLRANPVIAGSHSEFSQWLCQVHNVVNRSLGKPIFPCERVDARWGKLECEQRACDLLGSNTIFGEKLP